ncbi:hypothetical protein HMPREF1868_00206 [Olsenella sp. DNF00959]|nr:hypothetical protein HMPREF1868_00206 [Olsenella sp. DNF00959]
MECAVLSPLSRSGENDAQSVAVLRIQPAGFPRGRPWDLPTAVVARKKGPRCQLADAVRCVLSRTRGGA